MMFTVPPQISASANLPKLKIVIKICPKFFRLKGGIISVFALNLSLQGKLLSFYTKTLNILYT